MIVTIVLLIIGVILLIVAFALESKMSQIAEKRRNQFMRTLNEEQTKLIINYRNAVKVDVKDVFKKEK